MYDDDDDMLERLLFVEYNLGTCGQ